MSCPDTGSKILRIMRAVRFPVAIGVAIAATPFVVIGAYEYAAFVMRLYARWKYSERALPYKNKAPPTSSIFPTVRTRIHTPIVTSSEAEERN